jgi:hypothetical protein
VRELVILACVAGFTRAECDLGDLGAVAVRAAAPDAVVSAGAYTAVHRAGQDAAACRAAYATTPSAIAASATDVGAPLVDYSANDVCGDAADSRTSSHGFGEAVVAADPRRAEHRARRVVPITVAKFPTPARRRATRVSTCRTPAPAPACGSPVGGTRCDSPSRVERPRTACRPAFPQPAARVAVVVTADEARVLTSARRATTRPRSSRRGGTTPSWPWPRRSSRRSSASGIRARCRSRRRSRAGCFLTTRGAKARPVGSTSLGGGRPGHVERRQPARLGSEFGRGGVSAAAASPSAACGSGSRIRSSFPHASVPTPCSPRQMSTRVPASVPAARA